MFNFEISKNLWGDTVAFLNGDVVIYGIVFNAHKGTVRGEVYA